MSASIYRFFLKKSYSSKLTISLLEIKQFHGEVLYIGGGEETHSWSLEDNSWGWGYMSPDTWVNLGTKFSLSGLGTSHLY